MLINEQAAQLIANTGGLSQFLHGPLANKHVFFNKMGFLRNSFVKHSRSLLGFDQKMLEVSLLVV